MLPLIIGGAVVAAVMLAHENKKDRELRQSLDDLKQQMNIDDDEICELCGSDCVEICSVCGNPICEHQIVEMNDFDKSLNVCYECWKNGAKVEFVSEDDPELKYERKNLLEYKGKVYWLSVRIDSDYFIARQEDAERFLAVLAQRQDCQLIFGLEFLYYDEEPACDELSDCSKISYAIKRRHKYWKAMGFGCKLIG